ncbi:MAG: alkaline phosphatase family protein [Saprospiraceae bacterium]|nr:alkaline phosphatase family protein [Saprospiraceae bacterium]
MKIKILLLLFYLTFYNILAQESSANLIIITTDGLRWQEIYQGLDKKLVKTCERPAEINQFYAGDDPVKSRERILPFVWGTLAKEGCLYGNRNYKNKVDTRNYHRFSYPGYNEIFCGAFDPLVNSNKKTYNKNVSILEELNKHQKYHNKIAVFSSWELFPYILNEPRSGILINSGWEDVATGVITPKLAKLNAGHKLKPAWKGETRFDDLTWQIAMEYAKSNHPKVLLISLDDTDHFGHKGDYKGYLEAIVQFDLYLKEVWDLIQTDPFYKDHTNLLITTDHGRGQFPSTWQSHGFLPSRSGEIWFMEYGPGIPPSGEAKSCVQQWQASLASRMAGYCKIPFIPGKSNQVSTGPLGEWITSIKP